MFVIPTATATLRMVICGSQAMVSRTWAWLVRNVHPTALAGDTSSSAFPFVTQTTVVRRDPPSRHEVRAKESILQKSTATTPMPAEHEKHQPSREGVQRQQTPSQPRVCNQEVLSSPEGMNRKHAFDLRGRFAVRLQALWTRGTTLRTGPHTGHKTRPLGVARG